MTTKHRFWQIQNTGYSGGISWFNEAQAGYSDSPRYSSQAKARRQLNKIRWGEPDVKWRLVRVDIESGANFMTRTERYIVVRRVRGAGTY